MEREGEKLGLESEDDVVGAQNEVVDVDDAEPQDFTIEVAPQSPTSSAWLSKTSYPPSFNVEMIDVNERSASGDNGVHPDTLAAGELGLFNEPRDKVEESGDGGSAEHQLVQKPQTKRARGSDDKSGNNCSLSRSAEASQRLKENLRSGTFVVDEMKRGRFENKCCGLDGHAIFCYKESWQVKHSKCSKWVTMRESYDSVRFKGHVKGCKRAGEKVCDAVVLTQIVILFAVSFKEKGENTQLAG